jgi:hypothetical protein
MFWPAFPSPSQVKTPQGVASGGNYPSSPPHARLAACRPWRDHHYVRDRFGRHLSECEQRRVGYAPKSNCERCSPEYRRQTAAGIMGGLSAPGVYQLNMQVPEELGDGDAGVEAQIAGARTQDGVLLTVGQ